MASATPWTDGVDKAIFPDGFKTSGQQSPLYSVLQPFDKFPQEVKGSTVWKASDYKEDPEKWVHSFTPTEVAEISAAADKYISQGLPLTAITKVVLS